MLWFINFHISSTMKKQRGLSILWNCVFWLKWAVTERHLVTINFSYRSACLASAQLYYALERGCWSMLIWTPPACRLHILIVADLIFKFSLSKAAAICMHFLPSNIFIMCEARSWCCVNTKFDLCWSLCELCECTLPPRFHSGCCLTFLNALSRKNKQWWQQWRSCKVSLSE